MKTTSKHTLCVHEGTAFDQRPGSQHSRLYLELLRVSGYRYTHLPALLQHSQPGRHRKKTGRAGRAEEGIFFASGMAAISTILFGFLKQGDHFFSRKDCTAGPPIWSPRSWNASGFVFIHGWKRRGGFQERDPAHNPAPLHRNPSNPLLGSPISPPSRRSGKNKKFRPRSTTRSPHPSIRIRIS